MRKSKLVAALVVIAAILQAAIVASFWNDFLELEGLPRRMGALVSLQINSDYLLSGMQYVIVGALTLSVVLALAERSGAVLAISITCTAVSLLLGGMMTAFNQNALLIIGVASAVLFVARVYGMTILRTPDDARHAGSRPHVDA